MPSESDSAYAELLAKHPSRPGAVRSPAVSAGPVAAAEEAVWEAACSLPSSSAGDDCLAPRLLARLVASETGGLQAAALGACGFRQQVPFRGRAGSSQAALLFGEAGGAPEEGRRRQADRGWPHRPATGVQGRVRGAQEARRGGADP